MDEHNGVEAQEGLSSAVERDVLVEKTNALPKMHDSMPVSSNDLKIPIQDLDALLAVYGSLRSFSLLLRLSPFPLKTLCVELNQSRMSNLVDEVFVGMLTVRLPLICPLDKMNARA